MEKAMATHFSTLAWKIPRMEEPGGLQSMESLRVLRHDWVTSLSRFTFMHWRRKWQPLQCSCLENPRDGGAWWAAVYGVSQSRTRLKWLSSSRWMQIPGCLGGKAEVTAMLPTSPPSFRPHWPHIRSQIHVLWGSRWGNEWSQPSGLSFLSCGIKTITSVCHWLCEN